MKKEKFSESMSGRLTLLTSVASVAVLSLGALSVSDSAQAATIANTKHNLSSTSTQANKNTGTAQICVFCHTPHASDSNQPAPLWNKAIPAASSFTLYSSATMEGSAALGATSPSLVCLSCHDGASAMDSVINAPGSGLGSGFVVGSASAGWTGSARVGAGGNLTGIAALGPNLSNDHPIGIPYCGGGQTGAGNGSCNDTDFQAILGSGTKFWIEAKNSTLGWATTSQTTREKGDLPLYVVGSVLSVECGSCHDPHVEDSAQASGLNFMRATTQGSAICLSCHNK